MKKIIVRFAVLIAACGMGNMASAQNIYTYCGVPGVAGYSGDGSYATVAQLQGPRGVAVDASGNVYIADSRNNVVRKVTAGGTISTFAGNNTVGYTGDGGPATAAQLSAPGDVAVDAAGNVYIADTRNNAIRMVATSGTITTIAGNGTFGYTGDGGPATAAQLNRPAGIGLDATGKMYIADTRNNVVRAIDGSGNISTIAGVGTAGYTGDAGAATAAQLRRPADVAVDASNNIYIADNANNVVRIVSSTGTISTFAGTGTAGFSGDGGPATAATLRATNGIAVDASGNVYISETSNAVRMVNSTGTISTIAGNATPGYSGDGGLATAAQLNNPVGLAFDASGNIYIGDAGNDIVRRIGAAVTGISITSNTGTAVCLGSTTHFTASVFAFSNPHYQWQVNGTLSGTDSFGFTDAALVAGDVINCTLLDSAGNPVAISGSLIMRTIPSAGTITGLTTLCVGSTVRVRDTPTVAGGFWGITNSTVATLSAAAPYRVTGVTPGTDSVFYYRTNICGSDTAWAPFTVIPNIYGMITGPSSVCANGTATYVDTPAGGAWNVRPAAAGTIDPAAGTFTAGANPGTAYIFYGTPSCYVRDSITIDSLPVVDPIAGPTTVNMGSTITLTDPMAGGVWSSSDTTLATIGSTSGVVTGVANGTVTITYTVTNTNGCVGIATYSVYVDFPAGVASVQNTNGFNIYPNPASGAITLQWSSNLTGSGNMLVTDVTGRNVMTSSVDFTSIRKSNINISSLKPGVYMVNIQSTNGSYNTKLVVE